VEDALRAGAAGDGLTLIETLGWTGAEFPRLALHIDRLTRSAARLGWACDADRVTRALRDAAPAKPARLRLTLDTTGMVRVQAAALPPAKPRWVLTLAAMRLQSTDPWLSVKSSRRTAYDAARAALPAGVDEAVLQNERGEACDGTITTLFFDRGQGMRTPPLSSGLLPGVLRRTMQVPEETLLTTDLPHVRLWVGNSLRGLIPCSFILT
jgi:4-amino-4-deoxychorismate lyase